MGAFVCYEIRYIHVATEAQCVRAWMRLLLNANKNFECHEGCLHLMHQQQNGSEEHSNLCWITFYLLFKFNFNSALTWHAWVRRRFFSGQMCMKWEAHKPFKYLLNFVHTPVCSRCQGHCCPRVQRVCVSARDHFWAYELFWNSSSCENRMHNDQSNAVCWIKSIDRKLHSICIDVIVMISSISIVWARFTWERVPF